ncbi:putative WD repeat domain-containing protein [Rosellinia necatrix]|uniref:Putative WD repeat domain-containing protein n=1 Tax=Rosellinia necatrix TaxID=77044 RepID=A0A1W2TIF6_ROSNE|nr:putative WD repeat domain-containing protein [Rosellinia necatrix]
MAPGRSLNASNPPEIVDLTSDYTKDVVRPKFIAGRPHVIPSLRPKDACNDTSRRHGASASPAREARQTARPATGGEGQARPVKRQRTGERSPEAAATQAQQRRQEVAAALGRCLEGQIFPHIERATAALDPDVFDLDKLGAKVIKTIVNKDFERSFNQGNGRLLSSVELTIAAGIHRLVTELSSKPEYRRSLIPLSAPSTTATTPTSVLAPAPAPAFAFASASSSTPTTILPPTIPKTIAVPSILPSIENDVESHNDDVEEGTNGEGVDEEEDEDDDDEDDDRSDDESDDESGSQSDGRSDGQSEDEMEGVIEEEEEVEEEDDGPEASGTNEIDLTGEHSGIDLEKEAREKDDKPEANWINEIGITGEHSVIDLEKEAEEKDEEPEACWTNEIGINGGNSGIDREESGQLAIRSHAWIPHHHTPPKLHQGRERLLSQQLRTTAKVYRRRPGKFYKWPSEPHAFGLRPYASGLVRRQVATGVTKVFLPTPPTERLSQVFHVDFNDAEIDYLRYMARELYGRPVSEARSTLRDLRNILKKVPSIRASLAEIHAEGYVGYKQPPLALTMRSPSDLLNFLNDLYSKKLNVVSGSLFIEHDDPKARSMKSRARQIPTLLLSREITGNRLGAGRAYQNFITTAKTNREDYLELQVGWTDCAGDIMTVSWLSATEFICGTTTHSDFHNQQYNRPGNLLLGSAVTNTLRAYPDHRIVRPVVSSGDNAQQSMVASQDSWLFTSVVSSDYDPSCDLGFTSSFDQTVKVWKPGHGSITTLGTWKHEGRVNFVVTSKNGTGIVATAADVPTEAVRVYRLDRSNISSSCYDSYSCTRVHDEDYVPSDKWAYYPAAIRWGLAPSVSHLLLIGYSPRSPTGEDHEIPEDKLDTGELCLWNTITRAQVKVNSAKTQNVFEVAWHPSRASFAAATSASQVLEKIDQPPRTQIRVFEMNSESGQYGAIKTLDCAAIDINELAMMPNCFLYSYVAAGCTDGKVYVWDTAGSDSPMCVLEHGDPIEPLVGEREREDVGVKFTAWGTTTDRLYTGSSDGVVKVWNIRHGNGTPIRNILEAQGPITSGAFSPDFTRLAIGDGSGRVCLLALEDSEEDDATPNPVSNSFLGMPAGGNNQLSVRRLRPFVPHSDLPPPGATTEQDDVAQEMAREYLKTGQLVLHPDPTVGAVQGANYATTSLFLAEEHINGDPNEPLLAATESKQQHYQRRINPRNTTLLRQQLDQSRNAEAHVNGYAYQPGEGLTDDDGSDGDSDVQEEPDYPSFVDHATWLELKKERAELDDRLIELDYESSILDSDGEEEIDQAMDEAP